MSDNSPCPVCGLPWFGKPRCDNVEHANAYLRARLKEAEGLLRGFVDNPNSDYHEMRARTFLGDETNG